MKGGTGTLKQELKHEKIIWDWQSTDADRVLHSVEMSVSNTLCKGKFHPDVERILKHREINGNLTAECIKHKCMLGIQIDSYKQN